MFYENISRGIVCYDHWGAFIFQDCTYNSLAGYRHFFNWERRLHLAFQARFREYQYGVASTVCHGKCFFIDIDHRILHLAWLNPLLFILSVQIYDTIPAVSHDSVAELGIPVGVRSFFFV